MYSTNIAPASMTNNRALLRWWYILHPQRWKVELNHRLQIFMIVAIFVIKLATTAPGTPPFTGNQVLVPTSPILYTHHTTPSHHHRDKEIRAVLTKAQEYGF